MRKRGFTLIELLAVIVVLAIVVFIATPMILNTIESTRQGAAKLSVLGYVRAIENKIAKEQQYEDKDDYAYDAIEVDIKGTGPTGGMYSLKNGQVMSGVFCINGYEVSYADGTAEVNGNCVEEDLK